jgi:TonB family protein
MATLRSISLATIFIGFLTTYGVSVTANSQTWIEVRSPNFIVVTNSTDKQARRIGSQFELIRAVFLDYFGKNSSFSGPPINILAAKDEQTLRPLLPEFWGNKNSIHPAGVYVTGLDTSFVALRLDVNIYGSTDEPCETVYHEYVHHLMRHLRSQLPLWMVEGLAEFYGNTRIESRQVLLGVPSRWKILLLRDQHLLPVSTLFDINASSPYYHEENKVSIFYAESWALTHYLITRDWIHKTQHVENFVALLGQGVDPKEAARRSFGDLRSLDSELQDYVRRRMFTALRQNPPKIDDSAFHERALSIAESLAVRANFMAHDHHYPEAQAMLEEALKLEPKLPAAYENMGFLYFQQERTTEAAKWFAQAVELDPTNYRANYLYGASLLRAYPLDDNNVAKAEASLRAAIKDNPNFAPAYETLAYCLEQKGPHQKLDESYEMALAAVNRDPDNIHYRVRVVEVLEKQGHADDAIEAANKAVSLARTPSEEIEASAYLASAKQFKISQKKMQELQEKQSSASPSNQTAGVVNVQQPAIGGSTAPLEILTDTMGVDFGPYLSQLLQIVRQRWYQLIPESASMKQGTVLLEFAILKDGSVSGLKVVQSSGDVMLDRPAYGAITASNPFAPLPTEFKGPYLGLRFSFYYNVSPSPRNSSMAPFIEDVRKKLNENLSKDNNAKTDLEHDVTALTKLLDAGILDVTDNAAARYFRASAQTLLNVFRKKDGLTPDTAVNEQYLSDLDHIIAAKTDIIAWGVTRSEVAYRAGTIAWDGLHSSRTYSYWQICIDIAPCKVNLASGYTLGWEGIQPDPPKHWSSISRHLTQRPRMVAQGLTLPTTLQG